MIFLTFISSYLSSIFFIGIIIIKQQYLESYVYGANYQDQEFIHMNKSKSQSQLPNSSNQKAKSDFIYSVEDDAFIFQTKDLFMQVQFKSPIKQICEYLEQYQKYNFLAQISSIGIKAQQQKQFYDKISISINNQYQKFLQKSMDYIEDMIMNIHFMKFQKWHYYSQLVNGYKTNLLNKDLDCYGYNPGQFEQYYKKVMGYLININQKSDPNKLKQIKMELKANQKQIIKKAKQINENMYVKNPFKAQNSKKKQIQSNKIFQLYLKNVIYDTYGLNQAFDLKFHTVYDGIHKFSQFVKQFSQAGQAIAANIIKEYNQNSSYDSNSLAKPEGKAGIKSDVDMSDFHGEWLKNNKNLPILRNKMERVNFSNRIVWKDQDTSESYALTNVEEETRRYRFQEDDQIFANRVPANNPYFDFWAHTYDRDRLRKLQLFFEQPKHNEPRYVNKDYGRRIKRKINKQKKFVEQSIYQFLISDLKLEQQKIWAVQSKNQSGRTLYQFIEQSEKKQFQMPRAVYSLTYPEDNKLTQQQRKIEAYKEYHEKFEKDRKEDESVLVSLRKTNNQKIYQQFAAKFGIKDTKRQCSKTRVMRYGIKMERTLFSNKDLPKIQQFLCNFLREKLYREVEKYRDKEAMPLIMNFKPASQFCNWRTIKKLGELTQSMKRYFIWASQIIKYEQITAINKEVSAKFTIYSYSDVKHGQSILFELKRRLNIKVTGEIIEKYSFRENSIQCIISKLELMHRLLFNQHVETPNAELSILKGEQLFNLIMKEVANDSNVVVDY